MPTVRLQGRQLQPAKQGKGGGKGRSGQGGREGESELKNQDHEHAPSRSVHTTSQGCSWLTSMEADQGQGRPSAPADDTNSTPEQRDGQAFAVTYSYLPNIWPNSYPNGPPCSKEQRARSPGRVCPRHWSQRYRDSPVLFLPHSQSP